MQRSLGTLAARRISKSYGADVVLDDVSLVVPPRARIGVVGPNGIGKSTLLHVLGGLQPPDAGSVERSPESLAVGYLPQERDALPGESLLDYLGRRTGVAEAALRMDELAARLEREPELAGAHADALDRFLALGGDDLEARARGVCAEVGLPAERLGEPVGTLSGGQSARAALAAILLSRFDVLLLDEPTNDLDFAGLDLLERFLGETPAAVVLISHDRALLDRVVERIVELAPGSAGVREYAGGYGEYERVRDLALRRQYEDWEHYSSEQERLQEQARRRAQWVERATSQRRKKKTRDIRGQLRREIERLDRVEKPFEPWRLRVQLRSDTRSGDVVACLAGAVVRREGFRLGPVDLDLRWRDRLVVLGPNGSGKTTLLLALLGRLPLAEGSRRVGAGVVLGELEQGRQTFTTDEPLLSTYKGLVGRTNEADARTALAKFGLGPGHVLRPSTSLSPGERTRAALASFMARGVNVLVLDEPTNHLDLPAIEQLESALESFDGTAVVVSHDRRFLERFAPTRTLQLPSAP